MDMQPNVGKLDGVIRYIIGIALLLMVVLMDSAWRWVGLIGIVPIASAAFSFCPLWRMLGINTLEHGHGPHSTTH